MLSSEIAKERIADRMREAEAARGAPRARRRKLPRRFAMRVATRRGGSGLFAFTWAFRH